MKYSTQIIKLSDLNEIVEIHMKAFRDFFLTNLGRSFLKTYYKSSILNDDFIGICAINENKEIAGFAIGTVLSKGYHKKLIRQNLFPFIKQVIIIAFKNPFSIVRLYKNLNKTHTSIDDGNYCELLSIGVSGEYKGQGIGKLLIERFETEASAKGCEKVTLTTDYYENDDVVNFYQKRGYMVFYDFFTYPERKMYKLIKEI